MKKYSETENEYAKINSELEEIKSQLSKVKKRDYVMMILLPIATALISFFTAYFTTKSNFEIEELKFKQDAIKQIITTQNISEARRKINFLIESNLISDNDSIITNSLHNLRYVTKALELYMVGNNLSDSASKLPYHNNSKKILFKEAILKLTESIELDPYNDIALRSRGYCYFKLGQLSDRVEQQYLFSEAIMDFNNAINLKPNHPDYYYLRGLVKHNLNELKKAEIDYKQAIKLDSAAVEPFYYLGLISIQYGNKEVAQEYIFKALTLNTDVVLSNVKTDVAEFRKTNKNEQAQILLDLTKKYFNLKSNP